MGSHSSPTRVDDRQYGLLNTVVTAVLVGLALGTLAAGAGDVGGLAALGVVVGVAVGLGGLAAVPAVLRLVW